MATNRPNSFVLKGKDLGITYEATSFSGQPLLNGQYKGKKLNFMGADIRRSDTEIGQTATVDLGHEPDRAKITLTLLIPLINLEGDETSFQAEAIITEHLTSIGGPDLVKGAIQIYRFEPLEGRAKYVIP